MRVNDIVSIDELERKLNAHGIDCVRERFRIPVHSQTSVSAGFLCGAAGALLLSFGHPVLSFFAGLAGALVLILDTFGFSPLDWLGPKESRTVLVVPGSPSEKDRAALFLALPLACHLTSDGYFSSAAAFRRAAHSTGLLLSLSIPVFAGAATLQYVPAFSLPGLIAGAALAALAVAARIGEKPGSQARNVAVESIEKWIPADGSAFRPFILVYSGEVAEVKFFLAKYRHTVFRGNGIFIEFAENCRGPAEASIAEGEFPFLPYRVEPALLSRVRKAAQDCGISQIRISVVRFKSGALAAMARGSKAVTIFRMDDSSEKGEILPEETAAAWVAEIVKRS